MTLKKILSLLFLCVCLHGFAQADKSAATLSQNSPAAVARQVALSLKAEVDHLEVNLGEYITYKITAEVPENAAPFSWSPVVWPTSVKESVEIESVENAQEATENKVHYYRWLWRVWPNKEGKVELPSLLLHGSTNDKEGSVIHQGSTQAVAFHVINPLGLDPQPQFKGLKSPTELSLSKWDMLLIAMGVGIALAVVSAVFLWKRFHRPPPVIIPPELAHERAFRRLKDLQNFISANPTATQQFYFDLSEIFREFLEGQFKLEATHMTTQELLPLLEKFTPYKLEDRHKIAQLAQHADLIKYAEVQPTLQEMQGGYREVVELIEKVVFATNSPASVEGQAVEPLSPVAMPPQVTIDYSPLDQQTTGMTQSLRQPEKSPSLPEK